MVEAELVLGGLEAVLDRPAMAFDADQCLDRRADGTPGGEVGEIAVGDMTPDQQAARPRAATFLGELYGIEFSQFEIAPVMQAWPLGSRASRQALPVGRSQRLGDLFGSAATRCGLSQDENQ